MITIIRDSGYMVEVVRADKLIGIFVRNILGTLIFNMWIDENESAQIAQHFLAATNDYVERDAK